MSDKTFEIDVEAMFGELKEDIARSTPRQAQPKAGYGKVIESVPLLHEGGTVTAENKPGTGYVNIVTNVSIAQWKEIEAALLAIGAHISDKSAPNKAGFVCRVITLSRSETEDNEF